jgi:ATP-dependent Clp protease ATP-binding subunit ClpC
VIDWSLGTRKSEGVHRSPETRAVFAVQISSRAQAALRGLPQLICFAALLDVPKVGIAAWLQEKGLDVAALKKAALASALRLLKALRTITRSGQSKLEPLWQRSNPARAGRTHPRGDRAQGMDAAVVRTHQPRDKNNPLLLGEPGVGKTAVVEGLAWRIAQGNVPKEMRAKHIIQISLPDLIAGTKYRGEFERKAARPGSRGGCRAEVFSS